MSWFFTPYPVVQYDPSGENRPQLCIDITRRFKLQEVTGNSRLLYYDYQIKDRDRPDAMAERYYGDPRLDWIFFITNQIYDPYFQWPLNYLQFSSYLRQRYGSVSVAQGTVHHYEQIVTTRKEFISNYDNTTIIIPESVVVVDQTTYNSLAATARKSISVYDFEEDENNKHRTIKILDSKYIPGLMRDFRRIFEQ